MDGLFIPARRLDAAQAARVFSVGGDNARTLLGKKRRTGAANRTRDPGDDDNPGTTSAEVSKPFGYPASASNCFALSGSYG